MCVCVRACVRACVCACVRVPVHLNFMYPCFLGSFSRDDAAATEWIGAGKPINKDGQCSGRSPPVQSCDAGTIHLPKVTLVALRARVSLVPLTCVTSAHKAVQRDRKLTNLTETRFSARVSLSNFPNTQTGHSSSSASASSSSSSSSSFNVN